MDSNLPNGNGTMKCFRDLMQFFNSSTQALEKLLQSMKNANLKPVKPIQDNVTRWWSTYNSISRYLDDGIAPHATLLIANEELGGSCTDLSPTHRLVLKDVRILLHPMSKVQKLLEGEKYPTLSLVPFCIFYIRKCLTKATVPNKLFEPVTRLGLKMLKDFNTRYGDGRVNYHNPVLIGRNNRYVSLHPYHVFSSFLDPRFHHLDCVNAREVEPVWKDLKLFAINLWDENENDVNNNGNNGNDRLMNQPIAADYEHRPNLRAAVNFYDDSDSDTTTNPGVNYNVAEQVETSETKCNQEIISFRTIESTRVPKFNLNITRKEDQFDVVGWWTMKKNVYPILYKTWKRLIIVTATSAPSEREWSKLSNILTKNRNRLDHSFASDLMMVKENNNLLQGYMESLKDNNN
jgi:hypothetical protein